MLFEVVPSISNELFITVFMKNMVFIMQTSEKVHILCEILASIRHMGCDQMKYKRTYKKNTMQNLKSFSLVI